MTTAAEIHREAEILANAMNDVCRDIGASEELARHLIIATAATAVMQERWDELARGFAAKSA